MLFYRKGFFSKKSARKVEMKFTNSIGLNFRFQNKSWNFKCKKLQETKEIIQGRTYIQLLCFTPKKLCVNDR